MEVYISKSVSYLGALCSGHDGFPPRSSITSSTDSYVSSFGILRNTDKYDIHCNSICHDGKVSESSNSVFVNTLGVARKEDVIDCGSLVDESIENVKCGSF